MDMSSAHTFSLEIKPLFLEEVKDPRVPFKLRKFQSEILDFYEADKPKVAVLIAPTGSGKTLSAVLPLWLNRNQALCLYPTRELVYDQFNSIKRFLLKQGFSEKILSEHYVRLENSKSVSIVSLTGEVLEKTMREKNAKDHLEALRILLDETTADYRILVATPDLIYLLCSYMYMSYTVLGELIKETLRSILEDREPVFHKKGFKDRLGRIASALYHILFTSDIVFFDEYHSWISFSYISALNLLHTLATFPGERKIVVSSATMSEEIIDDIENLLGLKTKIIRAKESSRGALIRNRTIVEVYGYYKDSRGYRIRNMYAAQKVLPEHTVNQALSLIQWTKKIGGQTMIILDRVAYVKTIEDSLKQQGFKTAPKTGIKELHAPVDTDADVIIGNMAIELGIDNPRAVAGIVYGKSASRIIQRIGRIGRAATTKLSDKSIVHLVTSRAKAETLEEKLPSKQVSYTEFTKAIEETFPEEKTLRHIAKTSIGRIYLELQSMLLKTALKALYSGGISSSELVNKIVETKKTLAEKTEAPLNRKLLLELTDLKEEKLAAIFFYRGEGLEVPYSFNRKDFSKHSLMTLLRNFPVDEVIKIGEEHALILRQTPIAETQPVIFRSVIPSEKIFTKKTKKLHNKLTTLNNITTLLKLIPVYSPGTADLSKLFTNLGETPATYINQRSYTPQAQRLLEYLAAVSDTIPVYFRGILQGYVLLGSLALLPKAVS